MSETGSMFDEVKKRVDLVDYLVNHHSAEFVSDGPGRLAACCPFHEENTPSFKVTDSRSGEPWKTWHCYGSCATGGTVIDAVTHKEGVSPLEAVEMLSELYDLGITQDKQRFQAFKRTVAAATEQIEKAAAEMDSGSKIAVKAREFLHRRGFTDDTISHFGLAVHSSYSKAGRLAIPIFDKANHPLTVSHRALFDEFPCASCGVPVAPKDVVSRKHRAKRAAERNEEPIDWAACPHCGASKTEARIAWLERQHPKYRNEAAYEKSRLLYNEAPSRKALMTDDEAIGYFIMEGYADVWACHQAGQRACSSYNGASISSWQAGEAAKLCLSARPPRPLVFVPDFDSTGMATVAANIAKVRTAEPGVEIQVVRTLDQEGDPHHYKDLGELLQLRGPEVVADTLANRRVSAAEWLIREVFEAKNPKTGEPFHSKSRQMELTAGILSQVTHRIELDHLVPDIAERWGIQEPQARDFVYANITGRESLPAEHLMKTIAQAQDEAVAYLREDFVMPHGFEALDRCFPGGGARTGQLSLWLGKSGVGKTALMLQILANMARIGIRCIFFSLEQPAAQLFMRMTCQVLDVAMDQAIELIKNEDERLAEVREVFEKLVIIDNVPAEGQTEMVDMTAGRIHKIIHDVNMTRFDQPAQVVAVDHLGILKVGEDAPRNVQNDEQQGMGYIMQEMFHVCKASRTYFMVLQQLPKEVKQGEPIMSGDMGRGGAKQQDFADYVMGIWRPEQKAELDDEERHSLEGQYKLYPAKNRHGSQDLCHLYFNRTNMRIEDALDIMPTHSQVGATEEAGGEPVRVGATDVGAGEDEFNQIEQAATTGDTGAESAPAIPTPTAATTTTPGDGDDIPTEVDPETAPVIAASRPAPNAEMDPNEHDPAVPLDNQEILEALGIAPSGADDFDVDFD